MRTFTAGTKVIDVAQFARFFVGGVMGAAANLLAVFVTRSHAAYAVALAAGVAAGFVVSFLMSKVFAFQSRSVTRTQGELLRFVIVYMFGVCCYLTIAFVAGKGVLPAIMPLPRAEMLGAFMGTASMTVTSYFGHRFFTYRHMLGA